MLIKKIELMYQNLIRYIRERFTFKIFKGLNISLLVQRKRKIIHLSHLVHRCIKKNIWKGECFIPNDRTKKK